MGYPTSQPAAPRPDASGSDATPFRIAIWHNLRSGGAKRALYEQARALRALGHSLEIWCPPSADACFLPLSDFGQEHVVPLGPFRLPHSKAWIYRVVHANQKILERFAAVDAHARQAAQAINAAQPDVLLAHPCQFVSVPTLGRYVSCPTALYLQEPYRFLYEAAPELPWISEPSTDGGVLKQMRHTVGSSLRLEPHRIQAREELTSIRAFDQIFVNSYFSRESVRRAYGADARVLYLGINPEQFVNRCGERDAIVLSVGQFGFLKNPEFIIRSIALTQTRPVLRWIANFVNERTYAEQMQQLALQLGVKFELRVLVSDDELVREYQRASVLAYAPRLEPFGFAPLEGNACGLAVVALAEGGVRETVIHGENGLLVESPEEMAQAIDGLITDPQRARELGQRGATLVRQRWTLKTAATQLDAQLRRLVEAKHRGTRTASHDRDD